MTISQYRSIRSWNLVLLILLGLVLVDRANLLARFGLRYTGNDDTVYWNGAEDYSSGVFHEPCFYGQDYGYMVEALLAVPLLWAGCAHAMALPLATSLLALLPFLGGAFVFHRRGSPAAAALCLLVPLSLPVEHGLMTCIARGFVGGVAMATPLLPVVLGDVSRRAFIRFGLCAPMALFINPNAMPLVLMAGTYIVVRGGAQCSWYLLAMALALPFPIVHCMVKGFYEQNPSFIVHGMMELDYSPSAMIQAFRDLDRYFMHLGPLFWTAGWIWFLLLFGLAVMSWKKDRTWSVVIICSLLALLLFLGVNKVRDGWQTIFHSQERMFLAFPVLIAWALAVSAHRWPSFLRLPPAAVFAMGAAILGMKQAAYRPVIDQHTTQEDHGPVAILPVEQVAQECQRLEEVAREHGAGLVVFVPNWRYTPTKMSIRTYACPLLRPGMADTFLPVGDRRTWMYTRCTEETFPDVLVHGDVDVDLSTLPTLHAERLADDLVMVKGNSLPLRDMLRLLGVPMKRHEYAID